MKKNLVVFLEMIAVTASAYNSSEMNGVIWNYTSNYGKVSVGGGFGIGGWVPAVSPSTYGEVTIPRYLGEGVANKLFHFALRFVEASVVGFLCLI